MTARRARNDRRAEFRANVITGLLLLLAFGIAWHTVIAGNAALTKAREEMRQLEQTLDKLERDQQRTREVIDRLKTILPYAEAISRYEPDVPAVELAAQVVASAKRWGGARWEEVAWAAVALGAIETGWHTWRVGRDGERGPLQVLPSTARSMGATDLDNWRETMDAAIRYYARVCLPRAGWDWRNAAAVYNAGPSRGLTVARRIAAKYVENFENHASRNVEVR